MLKVLKLSLEGYIINWIVDFSYFRGVGGRLYYFEKYFIDF